MNKKPQLFAEDSFYKKHPIFRVTKDVKEICQPLFETININYFDYARFYPDQSFICLASDGHWLEYFFKRNFELGCTLKESGKHLWETYQHTPLIQEAAENFNYCHGISFFYKKDGYIEYFALAAPKENRKILNIYLNNFDVLEKFFEFFLTKSESLIQEISLSPITVSQSIHDTSEEDLKVEKLKTLLYQSRINMNYNGSFKLTAKELKCFQHLLQGKTAKQIGKELFLSPRTVESYLNKIKEKFNCRTRLELLSRVMDNNIFKDGK